MKLDTSHMRYLTSDDFRVLQAVELGSRNHELVPTQMIHSIGGLKNPAATNRAIGDLAKLKLLARLRNAKYDGFRITDPVLSAKLKKSAKDKIETALSEALAALEVEDSSADDFRKAELALKRAVTKGMSTR